MPVTVIVAWQKHRKNDTTPTVTTFTKKALESMMELMIVALDKC